VNLTLSDIGSTEAALAVRVKRWTFGLPGLALSILFLSPFFAEQMLLRDTTPLVLGIVLLFGWAWVIRRMFKRFSRHNPASSNASGIADRMSFHMVQHLGTKTEITAATILEAATESDRGLFVLHLIGIERADVLKAWKSHPEAMSVDTCLTLMTSAATELKAESLDSTATIYAFFKNVPALQDLLNTQDISIDDLKAILKAEAFHWYWHERHSHNFSPEALVRTMGAVGKSWVTGYNTELESLTVNLSEHAMSYARDTLIHTKELELILGWLKGRAQKNVLLIGKPGSGRRTLTRNLASLIRKAEMERGIGFTDVLKLSTPDLLSGCARGDSELLTALKKAADSGSFVLVIEDLPLLLEGSDARLKDVLYHLLQAGNIRTIGIIDTADYHARVKSDPALDTLFSKIPLSDSTDDETMAVLLEEYFRTTRRNPVRVTYKALKSLIDLSKRFLSREAMPGKAVSALREAISKANSTGQKVISDADVREIISVEARVDVRQLGENERMKLLELESRIGSRIIGHRDAISGIVSALKRARLDIQNRKRPIGTFLFLGTTGVGKTETAKALAEEYFGSAESFIRIDMNEYANEDSLPSLIGGMTQKGFTEGFMTKRIQDRPFSLVLLDEVEKAHLSVLHVFLQILDEGMMNDGNGVATDFKSAIIIATSNAGSHWIAATPPPADPAKRPAYKEALIKQVLSERAFSPEFLNRFDETVVFYPPTKDEIRRIAILMLDQIIRDIADKRGIKVTVESGVIDILAERGFHPEYGAREMRRVITRSVETYLADYLLSHTVKRGDEIVIHADDVRRIF
jgi:ATP-dependent Clp protease ATP-binding subunit ClpC